MHVDKRISHGFPIAPLSSSSSSSPAPLFGFGARQLGDSRLALAMQCRRKASVEAHGRNAAAAGGAWGAIDGGNLALGGSFAHRSSGRSGGFSPGVVSKVDRPGNFLGSCNFVLGSCNFILGNCFFFLGSCNFVLGSEEISRRKRRENKTQGRVSLESYLVAISSKLGLTL